jgi:hypothetical protein
MMMETAKTSGTFINFYQTRRRYNPEDSHLHPQVADEGNSLQLRSISADIRTKYLWTGYKS